MSLVRAGWGRPTAGTSSPRTLLVAAEGAGVSSGKVDITANPCDGPQGPGRMSLRRLDTDNVPPLTYHPALGADAVTGTIRHPRRVTGRGRVRVRLVGTTGHGRFLHLHGKERVSQICRKREESAGMAAAEL